MEAAWERHAMCESVLRSLWSALKLIRLSSLVRIQVLRKIVITDEIESGVS